MVKSHGDFVTIIDLAEGEHQYKFCVDGEWKNDRASKLIEDESGIKNNLITVKKSDFEVPTLNINFTKLLLICLYVCMMM